MKQWSTSETKFMLRGLHWLKFDNYRLHNRHVDVELQLDKWAGLPRVVPYCEL